MAGSDFKLDFSELKKLSEAFQRAAGMDIGKLLHEMGVEEKGLIQERFETKTDPEGNSWEEWSDSYKKRISKRGGSHSILMGPTARLQEDIDFEITHEGIHWGSPLPYARAHQKGYKENNLPARPYLGIGEEDEDLLVELVEDFIIREGGGLL